MSKFIKGFFNKPGQTAKGNEDTIPQNQPQQPIQKTSNDPLDRPFEVDINDLWKYDPEELTDYVHKYEKYTQDLKKMNISLQKELAAVRERLEVSEQEKNNLEQQLINTPGQSKDHDKLVAKHLKILESLSHAQQEGRSAVKLELLIEKHLSSSKFFSFKGQEDIHILTEMARNHLSDILENLKNLHKFPWETIEELFQGSVLDDLRDDVETEDAERTQISSIGGINLTAIGDRTDETDHHITFDTEFNRKKTDKVLVKNLETKSKVLKQRLENHLGLEISKSLLLDERKKSDIVSLASKLDQELTKLSEDVIAFTKNAEALRDQLTKPLVEDLEKIFPATGSEGTDLQKYCQQLEEYIKRMKAQIQEDGKTKLKEFEQISKEFDETKTPMRIELARYHERLVNEQKRNEALALELQSAQADKAKTEDHLKRKNDDQAHELEALEKQLAESKDIETSLLTKLKSFEDNTNKETTFDQIKDEAKKLQDEITKLEELNRKTEQEKLLQQNELIQERSKSENLKSEFANAESNIRDLKKKYDESCQKLVELEKEHYKASIRLKAFEKSSSLPSLTSTKLAEGEIKETDNVSAGVQNKENLKRTKIPESIIRLEKRINETIVALDEYLHGVPN